MNVELLKKIQAAILQEPRRIDMGPLIQPVKGQHACGTTACIAGWALVLDTESRLEDAEGLDEIMRIRKAAEDVWQRFINNDVSGFLGDVRKLLGLPPQYQALFWIHRWPKKWYARIRRLNPGTREYAEVVAELLQAVIDGEETFDLLGYLLREGTLLSAGRRNGAGDLADLVPARRNTPR